MLNEDIDYVVPCYEDIMRILIMCDHVRSACLVRHAVCPMHPIHYSMHQ